MDQSFGKILHNHTTGVIIFGLIFIFIIFPIIFYKLKTAGYEPFFDLTRKDIIELNDKQKLVYMIMKNYEKDDPELIQQLQNLINTDTSIINRPSEFIEKAYPIYAAKQHIFNKIIDMYDVPQYDFKLDFDDFFITSIEVFIIILQNTGNLNKNISDNFNIAINDWKRLKQGTGNSISASAPIPATESQEKAKTDLLTALLGSMPLPEIKGKPTTSASAAPVSASASLDNLTKPSASIVTTTPTADKITATRTTTPGLSQGADYNKHCPQPVKPAPPAPCPRPNPGTDQCACQQPIMNDGNPFDPNQYIRKDSIPCWNCSLP